MPGNDCQKSDTSHCQKASSVPCGSRRLLPDHPLPESQTRNVLFQPGTAPLYYSDVTIVKFKDHFDILLNEAMYPAIEISSYYRKMSQEPESEEVKEYLGNKLRQAEWIRQCIAQRSLTLMDVSKAILEHQEAFFSKGSNHLVPLRMTDIADRLGIHESTVSRAVSHKYLQCSWGVYPLSFSFRAPFPAVKMV